MKINTVRRNFISKIPKILTLLFIMQFFSKKNDKKIRLVSYKKWILREEDLL